MSVGKKDKTSKSAFSAPPPGTVNVVGAGVGGKKNVTLLARYCREHVPRSCDHSLLANDTRHPRPCTLKESFLTTGDSLTLELKLADSTALRSD